MKKKRFYKNVRRGEKWTEEEKGYAVDFADKYISFEGIYTDKFDYMRPKIKRKKKRTANALTFFKRLGIVLLCILIVFTGYTLMDVYMQRNGMPVKYSEIRNETSDSTENEVQLSLKCSNQESISMDGSVILDSVITELESGGYNAVSFDIKRSDGTVGFKSALATVDTYGSIAFPASNVKASVQKLSEQDILAVGNVYCYLDNLAPEKDRSIAILDDNGIPYTDSQGNMYLNPDSQAAYKYIKDIISEAADMGVTVFVLHGTELPSDIAENYGGGFEKLAEKLYSDLGTDIKLLEAVDVQLTSSDLFGEDETTSENSENEDSSNGDSAEETTSPKTLAELLPQIDYAKQVYCFTSEAEESDTVKILEESGISSYILAY